MRDGRRPLGSRLATWVTDRPELLLRLVGSADPVWVDGRRLHRGLQLVLALGERSGNVGIERDATVARARMRALSRQFSPVPGGVHVVDRRIPGPAGPMGVRVYRPHDVVGAAPGIVFLHGGGFVTGDLDTHDPTCRMLAVEAGAVVVAVDYRRAPEDPFPAAVDDATAAYRWVLDHAGELGILAGRLGVMGDSAGATLSAALCLEARRLGLEPPAAQCLVYPMVDARFRFASYTTFATRFGLTLEGMEHYRGEYLPDEADWTDPRASPLCADDLAGLPPALVVTAGFDPLRDDGAAYADALRAAGVPVTYRCYDDLIHAFHGMPMVRDCAAAAVEVDRTFGELLRSG